LFAIHNEFSWQENVVRLVEATNAIVGRSTRFQVTPELLESLLEAPSRAAVALATASYREVEVQLSTLVAQHRQQLFRAGALENVNIRGNTIEQIITGEMNAHRLDDLMFTLANGLQLIVDIKTKLLNHASAPKAYNIDKMLQLLAAPGTVFSFFFVGLDVARSALFTRLISIFDPTILKATRIQTHWAGRASRGVTQLSGDLTPIFSTGYRPGVDTVGGRTLLQQFLER
jgi:hypothetical protein